MVIYEKVEFTAAAVVFIRRQRSHFYYKVRNSKDIILIRAKIKGNTRKKKNKTSGAKSQSNLIL